MKIGFRIPGKAGELPFADLCAWATGVGFGSVDLPAPDPALVEAARAAGLEIGTVDLPVPAMKKLLSPEPTVRAAGVRDACAVIDAAVALDCRRLFFILLPEDPTQNRADSFAHWADSFPIVAGHAEARGARLALEGWPGPAPHYPALGCTPETWRAMFAACPSPAFGLNFDPSHLVRIGVDWRRALDEFGDRVVHAHGKDTDFDSERAYEHGHLGPTFRKPVAFSEGWWRYTIPGEGLVDWSRLLARLGDLGFDGVVSVELEDYRYHETWALQAEGLRRSCAHLRSRL
jgi:sugar phosphate isomerase/epimerase